MQPVRRAIILFERRTIVVNLHQMFAWQSQYPAFTPFDCHDS